MKSHGKLHIPPAKNLLIQYLKGKAEGLTKTPKIFEGTSKKPFTTVWRVQNKEGVGPYSDPDVDPYHFADPEKTTEDLDHDPGTQPVPESDPGFTAEDRRIATHTPAVKFGFASKEHLNRWFSGEELARLAEMGHKPVKVKAAKVWSSGKQAFFERFVAPQRAAKLKKSFDYSDKEEPIEVKPGSTRLRLVRDLAAAGNEGMIHVKDLKRQGHDTAALGLAAAQEPGKLGYISGKSIQNHIDKIRPMKFLAGQGTYEGEQQKHSQERQHLFVLKAHPETLQNMGPEAAQYLESANELSARSGHPTHDPNTLGWVRYTRGGDGHIHVDEVQTDLHIPISKKVEGESAMLQHLNEVPPEFIDSALRQGTITEDQAQKLRSLRGQDLQSLVQRGRQMFSQREDLSDENHNKLMEHAFAGHHPNSVVHEAFLEWLRQNPENVGKTVELWHAGPKAELTLFNPGEAAPVHMQETYSDQPRKMGYKPSEYGSITTQKNPQHKGKKTWQSILRKSAKPLKR